MKTIFFLISISLFAFFCEPVQAQNWDGAGGSTPSLPPPPPTPTHSGNGGSGGSGNSRTTTTQTASQPQETSAQRTADAAQKQLADEAQSLKQQGIDADNRGDYETAIKYFQDALAKTPNDSEIQDYIQKVKDQQKAFDQSKQEGLSQLRGISQGSDFDSGLKGINDASDNSTGLKTLPDVKTQTRVVDAGKVQAEIQSVSDALKRLRRSINLDADERKEWEKQSDDALRDSYALGANAALDYLGEYTKDQINEEKKEIGHASDLLNGETDPNRRERLHAAFGALKNRNDELEETKDRIEKAHDAVDILDKSQNGAYNKGEAESKNLLDAAWELCDKWKILPEGASQAKAIVDASYDITVQAYSVQRINALDGNSEKYLKAVDALNKRMKSLIKLKKHL